MGEFVTVDELMRLMMTQKSEKGKQSNSTGPSSVPRFDSADGPNPS